MVDEEIHDRQLVHGKATRKANLIQCVHNLMNIGLARRIYATEHNDQFPEDWNSLKKYLGASPVIMVCPADPSVLNPSMDWKEIDFKNTSYEFISPGGGGGVDPTTVVFHCPIHGNVSTSDGRVVQKHSETERL